MYFGARYYNPKTSLWLSLDPLAENLPSVGGYVYSYKNPIMFHDPSGLQPDLVYETLKEVEHKSKPKKVIKPNPNTANSPNSQKVGPTEQKNSSPGKNAVNPCVKIQFFRQKKHKLIIFKIVNNQMISRFLII